MTPAAIERLILGGGAFPLASFFLLISFIAIIQTHRTGRFSSGLHVVPSICAVVGKAAGHWTWKIFAVVVFLDLGGLLIAVRLPRHDDRRNAR